MKLRFARLIPLGLLLGGAMGCEQDAVMPAGDAGTAVLTSAVRAPNSLDATDLYLLQDSTKLKVGDRWSTILLAFGKPHPAFQFQDLPQRFQPPYSSEGWDTAREGVGAILYNGQAVAILHQLRHTDVESLKTEVDTIQAYLGPKITPITILGRHADYYFWEQRTQRLMVCALQTKRGGVHMTVALGDDIVLDALGINPAQARIDGAHADKLFETEKG